MQRKRCRDGRAYKRYFTFGETSARKQNAVFHAKLTTNPLYFASKAISCNATTERDDVAYWRIPHCRTTRRGSKWLLFTKMIQRAKLLFCQKRYYATQAMSRRTGHTRGISRSARRVRGSRMPFFTKKKIKVFRHRQDPPHRPDRGRYRSARSTPRRRRRTRGCTSARRCVEERSRHPVRWL